MMKRNNEGIGGEGYANSSNDDSHQKRRRVQFEAVRLPAVANVNDIKSRTLVYQAAQLRRDVLYKNKRIAELERENERAKRRQQTDETNFMKVYNLFSGIEKFVCTQVKNEFGDIELKDPVPAGNEVQGMSSDSYHKFVEQAKLNLKNAFLEFGKARQARNNEATSFLTKMKELMNEPSLNINEIHKELTAKCLAYASQLEKLTSENSKMTLDIHNIERKKKHAVEKYNIAENKIQELEHQLSEQREDSSKHLRNACKFEDRLIHIVSEFQTGQNATPTSSGSANQVEKKSSAPATPPSDAIAKEIENLRMERDEQASLASRRLQELEDINKKIQIVAQENGKLKIEAQAHLSVDAVVNSEEYRNLKKYYSLAVKEYDRVSKDLEEITNERDAFRNVKEARSHQMAEEHQKTMKEMQMQSDIHNTFYRVSHDSEILRCEFETVKEEYNKSVKQSEWDEMKATLNTFRSINKTMKAEITRLREKDKLAQKDLHAAKSELKTVRDYQTKCVLIPLDEDTNGFPTVEGIIRQEAERLRSEFKQNAVADRIEKEVVRRISDKISEVETLRKANEALACDEQCISDELETVCTAVEEEQERNAQLFIEKREQEDRNLKMMNDRMIQNQIQTRLREKLDCLENKAQTDAQIAKMHEFEKKASEDLVTKLTDTLNFKTTELTRVTNLMEQHRKQMQDLGIMKDELKIKAERYEEQLSKIQDLFTSKTREVEDVNFKKKRAEEELESIRVRYERAKRNDTFSSQSGDQVLEEAHRQLKETLTCPSCKTRQKDCIMLKCYHLFCETCIKTMYDTRQRKCPKCNSNFGANDFHRIFI